MSSPFATLRVGVGALSAAQLGVDTTGHNIANASSDGYTRQRVVQSAATPNYLSQGTVGAGVKVDNIARVFDNFVYNRYKDISASQEYADFTQSTLKELSTYFPEIDEVGIKSDLQAYYDAWQNLSDNPDNNAMKLTLVKSAQNLSTNINQLQSKVKDLQKSINDQLYSNVNEINQIAQQIADINKDIGVAEAGGAFSANDLRDKRDYLTLQLSKLIGTTSNFSKITSNIANDSNSNEGEGNFNINVGGFNIVDGANFHPIHIDAQKDPNGFYQLSYERQDGVLIPMDNKITEGRVGAILALRGDGVSSSNGGILQGVVDSLNAFASTLIQSTNNIYASSTTTSMESNEFYVSQSEPILNSTINGVNKGSFDIVVYDINGNESARRTININELTSLGGAAGSNSIEGQISASVDDNDDGNANNDINSYISYSYAIQKDGQIRINLNMDKLKQSQGYSFSIEDNLSNDSFSSGSNFAGAMGLNKLFDGKDATDMRVALKYSDNPVTLSAGTTSIAGDNRLALSMSQQQFESFSYNVASKVQSSSIYAMFDTISANVGINTKTAIASYQSINTQFNAVELEYSSISKVSIDEELTNLIKYQTSYGAASKIITTIDQMMQTLLGLKQ